jgi:protein-tyrosine kinase
MSVTQEAIDNGLRVRPAPADPAVDGATAVPLRATGANTALDTATPRRWLFPEMEEMFRAIYTRAGTGDAEVLAVCSTIAGEGKTTVSFGLGVTIAQDFPERRVLVVETDLQRPLLAADFEVEATPGLADCLLEDRPFQDGYRATFLDNLHLLPAGIPDENAGRLLRSSRMAAVDAMRQTHDVVIMDVPAVLVNSDAALLTDLADGVVFVVQAGVTPTAMVSKALEQIDETKVRGIVLNGARSSVPRWLRRLLGLSTR